METAENRTFTDRLAALATHLPAFEAPGFSFGRWNAAADMPVFEFSEAAARFLEEAYRVGLVLPEFDWGTWVASPAGRGLLEDPSAVANADAATLAKLLTAHIRQERFCEGHLAAMFESGHLTAILRRARDLQAGPGAT